MEDKGELIDALTDFIRRKSVSLNSVICKVKEYNDTDKTCYCEPIGDYADLQQIRIIADSTKDGFLIVPKIGSIVVVSLINDEAGYISMFSEVEEIHLAGVKYGGLAKTEDLKNKLNNIENKLNFIITAFNGWTPVASDGGAALKALMATLGGNLTLTTQASISSTTVYHGDGM